MYLSFASRGSTTFCSQPQLFTFKSCPHTEHRPLHSSRQTTCMGKARSSCSRKIGSKSIVFPLNQSRSASSRPNDPAETNPSSFSPPDSSSCSRDARFIKLRVKGTGISVTTSTRQRLQGPVRWTVNCPRTSTPSRILRRVALSLEGRIGRKPVSPSSESILVSSSRPIDSLSWSPSSAICSTLTTIDKYRKTQPYVGRHASQVNQCIC